MVHVSQTYSKDTTPERLRFLETVPPSWPQKTLCRNSKPCNSCLRNSWSEPRRFTSELPSSNVKRPTIQVGDKMWQSMRYLPTSGRCHKLQDWRVGLFEVEAQINPVAYRLKLPPTFKIYPVFHQVLLTVDYPLDPHRLRSEPVPPLLVEGQEEYEVEQILDSRKRRGRLQYLIHWKGYDQSEHSWETAEDVHTPDLVRDFHEAYPEKPRPRGRQSKCMEGGMMLRPSSFARSREGKSMSFRFPSCQKARRNQ
ncbi:uncharacterized protein LOC133369836 [Rhineura floridana]|uniref:uncharacterized protein LOC133369836 n=1 Tax=Rhineura floridana TaxID=261503 RepID=UPI002AC86065|nr:uncharacterized protein LOC133369836 [Rhineura floridana]